VEHRANRETASRAQTHLLCSWRTSLENDLDAAGSITSCARCGAMRHGRTESVKDGSFKAHVNVAED